ncbi:MAG: signal peptidase II [Treponemataceae bacterium]|nr:signal peptidase II [Treponemataceae bacterium]
MTLDKTRKVMIWTTIITFVINFGLDRLTKILATIYLKGTGLHSYLKNIFVLVYAQNTGAFLSMGAHFPLALKYILLIVLPLLVCLAGLVWCIIKETDKFRCILFTSVLAGGIGNLVDRIFNDFSVIDFMNFGIGKLRTGILNVADLSITFGVIIFLIYDIFFAKDKFLSDKNFKKKKSEAKDSD